MIDPVVVLSFSFVVFLLISLWAEKQPLNIFTSFMLSLAPAGMFITGFLLALTLLFKAVL